MIHQFRFTIPPMSMDDFPDVDSIMIDAHFSRDRTAFLRPGKFELIGHDGKLLPSDRVLDDFPVLSKFVALLASPVFERAARVSLMESENDPDGNPDFAYECWRDNQLCQ